MSWIDQGRQQHGWFGHGTAPQMDSGEFGARAFAAVQFAADDFPSRDKLPFPLEKTTEVLRTFASMMAPAAELAPNDFRLRFFRASFDPVDAWTIQLIMRGIAAADTHAGLVQSGRDLATTIRAHGPDGWNRLLGTALAQVAPVPPAAANGEAKVQKAQFAVPAGPLPLPLPPQAIPGTRENRALTDATIKGIQKLGEIISRLFESRRRDEDDDDLDENGFRRRPRARPQPPKGGGAGEQDGETHDKPPPGSKPISDTPWSGDHDPIKKGIGADPDDDVRISPDQEAWVKNPDGTWTNRGPVDVHTGSGKPAGRTGKDRNRRPNS